MELSSSYCFKNHQIKAEEKQFKTDVACFKALQC